MEEKILNDFRLAIDLAVNLIEMGMDKKLFTFSDAVGKLDEQFAGMAYVIGSLKTDFMTDETHQQILKYLLDKGREFREKYYPKY